MTKRRTSALAALCLFVATGCPTKAVEEGAEAPKADDGGPLPPSGEPAERPEMTNDECTEQGGSAVGDIGNGAIHRPDYRCENGEPPLGTIVPVKGEPVPIEGAVCCPSGA